MKGRNFTTLPHGVAKNIAALGDSITNGEGEWDEQLNALCRARIIDKGVDGNRLSTANNAASVEARFDADVDDADMDEVIIPAGINDIKLDTSPVSNMQNTVAALHAKADGLGIAIAFCNVSPFGGNGAWTAAKEVDRLAYNSWLASYCSTNSLEMYDIDSVLRDPADTKMLLAAYHDGDELHPNFLGATQITNLIYNQSSESLNADKV